MINDNYNNNDCGNIQLNRINYYNTILLYIKSIHVY